MGVAYNLGSRKYFSAIAIAPASSPPSHHFPTLDGLRGGAILAVVAMHYSPYLGDQGWEKLVRSALAPGHLGVTLFFALSGFLITRILLRTRENRDYFQSFYLRRSLRIFPLYFAYLAFLVLAYYPYSKWQIGAPYHLDSHYLWYVGFASNIPSNPLSDPGLMHFWSLAIEEQFYLVWPLVIFLVPHRWLLPVCLAGFLGSLGCRVVMALLRSDLSTVYLLTTCRMDALLTGAAVGIIELDPTARERLTRAIKPILLGCGAAIACLFAGFGMDFATPAVYTWGWAITAILFAVVVFWAATTGSTNRLLTLRWLRTVGRYSYGIYVLHFLPMFILPHRMSSATPTQRLALIMALVTATAVLTVLSWHLIELPFLRKKRQLAPVS